MPRGLLQALLSSLGAETFNCVTVDGDTSTNDTLLLFATGWRGCARSTRQRQAARRLSPRRLNDVLLDLAHQVVRDGEGAEQVRQDHRHRAPRPTGARRIAHAIAKSPLVKTAIAGEDANWGRIVMAVGKAGEPADRDRLAISSATSRWRKAACVIRITRKPISCPT